jgi:exportin-1
MSTAQQQTQEAQQALSQLLDFSQPFPTQLFDNLVHQFQISGNIGIDQVIKEFQKHTDAWTRVPDIVQNAQYPETKVQALAILESLVKTRWNTLGAPERDGIRNFIITLILQISQTLEAITQQRVVLGMFFFVFIYFVFFFFHFFFFFSFSYLIFPYCPSLPLISSLLLPTTT